MQSRTLFQRSFEFLLIISFLFEAVGFFPGTDTQPNFIVLSTVYIFLFSRKFIFNKTSLILFFICITSIFSAFLFQSEYLNLKYSLTYIVALLTYLNMYILLTNGMLKVSSKFVVCAIAIYAVVGFIQFFIPDFLSFMVTRSVDAAYSFAASGRGSRSLSGEPAQLGKIFIILNLLWIFIFFKERKKSLSINSTIVFSIAILFINVCVSRSFYAVFFHFMIIVLLIFFVNKKLFYTLLLVTLSSLSILTIILNNIESTNRFIGIFQMVVNDPSGLLQQGAIRRVFNIMLSLNNLSYFPWYGAGSSPDLFNATLSTPLGELSYQGASRAYGGIVEFLLKFGVFSFPIFMIYFYVLFQIFIMRKVDDIKWGAFFAISIFCMTFQDGAVAKPLPIFLFVFIYVYRLDNFDNGQKLDLRT